ncbi:MAG TPA: hypothetical protein VGR49_00380 [Actinomycetota bacterium]|nr:hypothetical protein [Actinomycetota bacterium]
MSDPPATLLFIMGAVIDLGAWRQEREPEARLQRALDGLDDALAARGEEPPEWLRTEMLAALGSRHLGMIEEAAGRLERAAERLVREERRRARRR